jgi:hypothetical protein
MTMTMEKRNLVEEKRTPDHELRRDDEDWDKQAAGEFAEAVAGIDTAVVEPDDAKPAPKSKE